MILTAAAVNFSGCTPEGSRTSDTRFLLDTVCTVTGGGEHGEKIVGEVFDLVSRIADEIDCYNPDSVVSEFNNAPPGVPVSLGEYGGEIVARALEISRASGGAFDITVAPAKDLWDFKSENPSPPEEGALSEAVKHIGFEKLVFDEENRTLAKTEEGVKIDLGGCGKGYCCQAALDYIAENYPDSWAILDFGGNVGVYGKNPANKEGNFTVGIQDPKGEEGSYSLTEVISSGMSAVTSGTYQRHFVKDGINYHHILDPKTGMPASNGHESATVICTSGLVADCLSTACMVLPQNEAQSLAEKYDAKLIFQ